MADDQNINGNSNPSPPSPTRSSKIQMAETPFPELKMPLGHEEICAILPHRYPFLLVDRILEVEPGVRCVGLKNVSANEEHFNGHFPGHPVMPGVLILEAMAQVAGVLILVTRNTPGALSYFASIEKARFRHPVRPGDQVITEATLQVLRGSLCKAHVVGRVDGQVVVEADYTFFTTNGEAARAVHSQQMASLGQAQAPGSANLPPLVSIPPAVAEAAAQATAQAAAQPVAQPSGNEGNAAPSNGGAPATQGTTHGATQTLSATRTAPSISVLPPRAYEGPTFVHPSAIVDPRAELEEGVWIGPFCIIEGNTRVGAGTVLESHVVVKQHTSLGRRCRVSPYVVLGHEPQDVKFHGEESYLRIGDDNVLREMVTLHRATGEGSQTVIGNNNILMAYVHVGHNCSIGSNTMISNSTGIAGHVTIEDKVVIGGFVGVHQFAHIGKMAMLSAMSKVVQDVPPFCLADGRPAKITGLNIRGLRRNGINSDQRNQVSSAFKYLYRSGLNTSQALEKIYAEVPPSETLDYFLQFVERVREGRLGRQDETPHL
jgi:UDP-N-acetylglucosamine acyltransferase